MEEYIIGVDAGGTKTSAALYDHIGNKIFEARSGYGNMLIDTAMAKQNIISAISKCLAACPRPDNAYIYVGAAGIRADGNLDELNTELSRIFPNCKVRIEDDAILALYALTKGCDGILVIAGTGSIAYAKLGQKLQRAGGWGNLLGDEGSGYYIARRGFSNITAEYDSGKAYSLLSNRLLVKLDTDVFGVVKYVHSASKGDIASFLPIVERAARDGDASALLLLKEAGQSLAALAIGLSERMGFTGKIPVAIKGGVLEKIELVRREFTRILEEKNFEVSLESAPSELGAYYIHISKGEHNEH